MAEWFSGSGSRRQAVFCCQSRLFAVHREQWTAISRNGEKARVHGIYRFELLPDNTTVTAEVYCAQLQRLADKIRNEHPKLDNVRLLHDNARPHIAKKTFPKILELGWEVLPHPPYSPGLAPSDYHLFRSLQHHLEEKCYDDRDRLENDLRVFFASKSSEFYAKGIRELVRRWQRVVDVDGDYFVE
ncbi:hypothetical protein RB195_005991 [Necator americanus]|uniref:Transposase n=1 Tax=Necator americanus TaxID=51031 RepID=A0ABR1BQK2_NECAM